MASFGHVAVGLMAGRLHGGGPAQARADDEPCPWRVLLLFAGLAVLPDADVLLVALGAPDHGPIGHRGASHSFGFALIVSVLSALIAARTVRWSVVRTALAGTLAVGSHALLDLFGESGKGLALFWPLTAVRFRSPVRIFPDAPRGFEILSWAGLAEIGFEFLLFSPVTFFALWPRIAPALGRALAAFRRPALRPQQAVELKIIDGGGASAERVVIPSGAPTASTDTRQEPPVRSSG
jgi:inner membrane protein